MCVNTLSSMRQRWNKIHLPSKRSPFCPKCTLEEPSAAVPENVRKTPGLFPVGHRTVSLSEASNSEFEPDVPVLTGRPQDTPDPDLSHVSSPLTSLNKTHPAMISHGPPAITLTNGHVIPDAPTTTANKAKQRPNQRKRFKFPMKGVFYLFGRSNRCLCCNYQFWMRRKWDKVTFLLQKLKTKRQTTVRSSSLLSCCPKPKRQANITNPLPMVSCQTPVSHNVLKKHIHEFLNGLYRIYGSFIPLQKEDALTHLKKMFNIDFNQSRKDFVFSEVRKYQATLVQRPVLPSFRVVYKKHLLTLDDLSTLEDQNWLNDQVINMYGELIMDSAHNKVHFFNSFFHRQLVTKGYDGVKRWTKQVDLFSKRLLLVPVHLDVHWCLVTGDTVGKTIRLYDSQGNAFREVAMNILNYLVMEAKHRQQSAFQRGWTVSHNERIPQQTNENDCGVFILEYCRCFALGKRLTFSQVDMPRIRKRIYKELCGCKLQE